MNNRVRGEAKVGDRVSYEDMANPRRTFRVVATQRTMVGTVEYEVEELGTGERHWSDLRQYGWQFEEANDVQA